MRRMNVLLIDDHAIFRRGLCEILREAMPSIAITEAESVEGAMAFEIATPNLVLLDIKLPGVNGLDGTALIKQRWPATMVVILSALETTEAMSESLACGATGFVSKAESADRILGQITLAMGQPDEFAGKTQHHTPLTPRQREVLDLLCQGMSNKLIARRLSLSENTARRHVQAILDNFKVDSRSKAIVAARRRGLVE
jgi:DNA-binding NarL/FixJ family response regulator